MPNVDAQQLPPPRHWQDFESLCRDLWAEIWEDPNAQLNGRSGQQQNGVAERGGLPTMASTSGQSVNSASAHTIFLSKLSSG